MFRKIQLLATILALLLGATACNGKKTEHCLRRCALKLTGDQNNETEYRALCIDLCDKDPGKAFGGTE